MTFKGAAPEVTGREFVSRRRINLAPCARALAAIGVVGCAGAVLHH
jgi:hypothetical protein